MIIHSGLIERLRGNASAEAVDLYVTGANFSLNRGTPGRFSLKEMRRKLGKERAERIADLSIAQELIDGGFWQLGECIDDDDIIIMIADWGEWILLEGEAGEGAE